MTSNACIFPNRDFTDTKTVGHPLLELCLTTTKGLGLFAKKDIKAGTCIISEKPILVLSSKEDLTLRDLQQQLDKLTPAQQDAFLSLSCSDKASPRILTSIKQEAIISRKPLRDDFQLSMEAKKIMTFVPLFITYTLT